MAVVMRCDRCKKDTDNFIEGELPDGWRYLRVLQRGSQGAWSDGPEHVICYECDKALYDWFHYDAAGNRLLFHEHVERIGT